MVCNEVLNYRNFQMNKPRLKPFTWLSQHSPGSLVTHIVTTHMHLEWSADQERERWRRTGPQKKPVTWDGRVGLKSTKRHIENGFH